MFLHLNLAVYAFKTMLMREIGRRGWAASQPKYNIHLENVRNGFLMAITCNSLQFSFDAKRKHGKIKWHTVVMHGS